MSLYSELKRRNVFRVAIAYLAGAWLITEVSETLFPLFGYGDTPARIIVILLAISLPLFLIFSWVFEITPEGLRLERDVIREESITPQTGKRIDRLIIVLLIAAVGYFAFDKFVLEPVRDAAMVKETAEQARSDALVESFGDKSIAVLPFVNMSADPEQEYFSDGISEELLNHLSKIPELRVISRSSAFSFKGKDLDIFTIASQLNVAQIIEGSVRKDGNQVRITAQLIEARSDTHLWSETYDRELENIFAVQEEIAVAIVGALKENFGLETPAAPLVISAANTEAHDAYLRGRYLVVQRTKASIEGAVREFEKAITLDPDYALAHAELSIAILLLNFYGDLTVTEAIARAIPHTERAMALDPNLAETHAATGFLLWLQQDLEEALSHYRRAIEINPNYSSAYLWMQFALRDLGRYEELFSAEEAAYTLDPRSIPAIGNYAITLILRGRLDDAGRELEKLASISPAQYALMRGYLAGIGGQWANTALGTLEAVRINPEIRVARGFARPLAYIGLGQGSLNFSGPVWPEMLRILGRPAEAVDAAENQLVGDSVAAGLKPELGLALAAAGDYPRASSILEETWQRSQGRVTQDGLFASHHAAALIAIRRDAGDETGVGELLAAIRDNVLRCRETGFTFPAVDYEDGLVAYLSGERDRGLALIARAVEDGHFILPSEAYLQTLYEDPGFAPIRAGQEARQARERNRFLAIVCTDNPYSEVWQPAEGTCERYRAGDGN
jgi:TolB-like protein/Tfp pilus assembly protein PilF